MKVYNKKTFAFGVAAIALGCLNVITAAAMGIDLESVILIAFLLFFGIGSVRRSFSQKFSTEDKLDELDERNQLIELKSKRKSFQLTQAISFTLMLLLLIMAKVTGYGGFVGVGAGLGFAFSISMFTELLTYFYYEKNN